MNWRRFCLDDPLAEPPREIAAPFVVGGWRYATDGRIAVRSRAVGRDTATLSERARIDIPKLFEGIRFESCVKPLPRPTAGMIEGWDWCFDCQDLCECGADPGEDGCDGCVNGVTYKKSCPSCHGTGKVPYEQHYYYRFDGALVDGKYLAILHDELPGASYAVGKRMDPVRVYLNGLTIEAQALIAQVKAKSAEQERIKDV